MAYTKCKPNPNHGAFFIGKRNRVSKLIAIRKWARKKWKREAKKSNNT